MHIPVHSPWLPGYMDVAQTVLIILTMVGFFSRQTLYNSSIESAGVGEFVFMFPRIQNNRKQQLQNKCALSFIKEKLLNTHNCIN